MVLQLAHSFAYLRTCRKDNKSRAKQCDWNAGKPPAVYILVGDNKAIRKLDLTGPAGQRGHRRRRSGSDGSGCGSSRS
jgi:hypothetical protein